MIQPSRFLTLKSNLSPVHTVAENGDCRTFLRQSTFSATIVASVDRLLDASYSATFAEANVTTVRQQQIKTCESSYCDECER